MQQSLNSIKRAQCGGPTDTSPRRLPRDSFLAICPEAPIGEGGKRSTRFVVLSETSEAERAVVARLVRDASARVGHKYASQARNAGWGLRFTKSGFVRHSREGFFGVGDRRGWCSHDP